MSTTRVRLGVNIDHVATIRNARGGDHPDPVLAAEIAARSGADGITLHIREDRRHMREDDLLRLAKATSLPINLEMACTDEMREIALRVRPHACCLVPERREERTTEGGLDVVGGHNTVAPYVGVLGEAGMRVSLFIGPDLDQVAMAVKLGAPVIELHVGAYCEAFGRGDEAIAATEFEKIKAAAEAGSEQGLEVHAGHGITFDSVGPLAALPQIAELNIGHFIIGEAIFCGLGPAVAEMRRRMDIARPPA